MAVVALQIVGALALKLYDIVQTVSANRTQCGVIGDRVSRIMTEVERLDPNKHETLFKKGVFANFQNTLEIAIDLCSKFVNRSTFRQWFACNSNNEKFDTIVVRLDQAIQDLHLSFAFDTSTWQQAQKTDTGTMIDIMTGLVQRQKKNESQIDSIIDALAEMTRNFEQGTWNVTKSPTDVHLHRLNSKQINFDRVKDEEDLWHKTGPLDSGSFGTVPRGRFRGEAVAIKSVNFTTCSTKAQETCRQATFVSDVAQRSSRLRQNLDSLIEEEMRRRAWGLGIAKTDKKKPGTSEKELAKGVLAKTTQIDRNEFEPTPQARLQGPPRWASHEDTTAKAQPNPHPQPGQASLGLDIRRRWPRRVQTTHTSSCIFASCTFEGGANVAIENFTRVFKFAPEDFVEYGEWKLISMCRTVEKQKAVAFMLATNATVAGWNGTLNLGFNDIGDEGAKHIGHGVKPSTLLKAMHLGGNNFSDEGFRHLTTASASVAADDFKKWDPGRTTISQQKQITKLK